MNFFKTIAAAAVTVLAAHPALAAHWGDFKNNGCVGTDLRSYSSVLWDIPWGASWEQACASTPARVKTAHGTFSFSHPTLCTKASAVDAIDATAYVLGVGGLQSPPAGVAGVVLGGASYFMKSQDWGGVNMWGVFYVQDPRC